jgi:hypothetical protein
MIVPFFGILSFGINVILESTAAAVSKQAVETRSSETSTVFIECELACQTQAVVKFSDEDFRFFFSPAAGIPISRLEQDWEFGSV